MVIFLLFQHAKTLVGVAILFRWRISDILFAVCSLIHTAVALAHCKQCRLYTLSGWQDLCVEIKLFFIVASRSRLPSYLDFLVFMATLYYFIISSPDLKIQLKVLVWSACHVAAIKNPNCC